MAVGLYMDVHVPQAITDQLRRRGVDVLTAIEDAASGPQRPIEFSTQPRMIAAVEELRPD